MNKKNIVPIFLASSISVGTFIMLSSKPDIHDNSCGDLTNVVKKEIVDVEFHPTDKIYLVHTYKDGDYEVFETTPQIYEKVEVGAACVLVEKDANEIDDIVKFMNVRI